MQKSKYLEAFAKVAAEAPETHKLVGDFLLVEVMKDEEFKTKSGLIMSTEMSRNQMDGMFQDRPTFARVLMAGAGYFSEGEDGKMKDVPLDTKPGDIVLVGRVSIKHFSVFGKLFSYGETTLGLCRDSDVQMRFSGDEGFERFFAVVNSAAQKKVEPEGNREN